MECHLNSIRSSALCLDLSAHLNVLGVQIEMANYRRSNEIRFCSGNTAYLHNEAEEDAKNNPRFTQAQAAALHQICRLDILDIRPNPVIACGGKVTITACCLVLDQSNQHWDESRMGNLTMPRKHSAVASLNSLRVFIIAVSYTHLTLPTNREV